MISKTLRELKGGEIWHRCDVWESDYEGRCGGCFRLMPEHDWYYDWKSGQNNRYYWRFKNWEELERVRIMNLLTPTKS